MRLQKDSLFRGKITSTRSFMFYIVHIFLPVGGKMDVDSGDWPFHTSFSHL